MNEVQELAYYKWEQAGCPDGRDLEFWLEAEEEFSGSSYAIPPMIHIPETINIDFTGLVYTTPAVVDPNFISGNVE
jgi:hypothetical protein